MHSKIFPVGGGGGGGNCFVLVVLQFPPTNTSPSPSTFLPFPVRRLVVCLCSCGGMTSGGHLHLVSPSGDSCWLEVLKWEGRTEAKADGNVSRLFSEACCELSLVGL